MSLEIYYTPNAKSTLKSVYSFIINKFGKRVADKFITKSEKTIDLIAEYLLMFKASEFDENVSIGLITKQCSIFYKVTKTQIILLYFWDNRQEPILR